jgi:hypothetical protein
MDQLMDSSGPLQRRINLDQHKIASTRKSKEFKNSNVHTFPRFAKEPVGRFELDASE